ncbi:arabinosyltransferase domain-containing protein [Kineococcus terrestris]|uniref:arabinosyltransferase domain-containing protein n=1 Tax=Kineococcus terrestris TaxID=2044856 RepID=UPI0034DAC0C3
MSPARTPGRPQRPGALLALLLGALTCLLSLAVPLAPVVASTPTVTWPQAGQQGTAEASTVALFMPYRPVDVRAQVPCAALTALDARTAAGERATGLATAPDDSARGEERSLAVTVGDGELRVRSSGAPLVTVPLAQLPAGCALEVVADQDGTRVGAGGPLADEPGLPVPEVTAFTTDLAAADLAGGAGPAVTASPDARFETRPTALKSAVVLAHVLLAAASLVVLALLAGPAPRRRRAPPAIGDDRPGTTRRTRTPVRARPLRAVHDAAVGLVLLVWAGAGPLHTDDFYYVLEGRAAPATGYVGNVVRYFNVPEIPFTLQQELLGLVAQVTVQPWAVRLPAALCGIGTWLLLTRVVLPRVVQDPPAWTWPLTAVVLLAWWLPFDVSARPESLVVLLSTAVLALVLEAVERRRAWLLGVAALLCGTAVAVTASGLLATATALVLAPRWWPVVRESRLGAAATSALLLAAASVASPVVFADATLAAALTALRVHDEVGPNQSWWEEAERYWYLTIGPDPNQRLYSRQVVVLLTLVLLVGVTTALLRARRASGPRTAWVVPVAVTVAGFAVLTIAPTKWSHHFGALAGAATLLTVTAAVVLVRRRPARWPLLALWAFVCAAAGVAFHGPDAQVEYSAYGTDPALPERLSSPLLWAALSAAAGLAVWWWRRRRVRARERDAWPEVVVAAVAAVLAGSLALQVLSVAAATHRLRGSWSVAADAVDSLGGSSCGFADAAVALTGQTALAPADVAGAAPGTAAAPADPGAALDPLPDTVPQGADTWAAGEPGAAVVTPWRALGERAADETLAFDVHGEPSVTVEFADEAGRSLPVPAVVPGGDGWRRVGFGPVADAPAGAVAVRVVLTAPDGEGEPAAVTDVYRRTGQVLTDVLPADAGVLVDWPIGLHLPCQQPPRVAGGLVEPVGWLVRSATFEGTPMLAVIDGGGSYATLPEVATLTPYRGFLPGAPYREWGDLVEVTYDLPTGGYDVAPGERTVPGWRWWEGAGPGPSPQEFIDRPEG